MAWVEPEIWYESLPTFYAAAGVLITDPLGRLLLVKPNYHDLWAFPGGMIEADESPHEAAAREVAEELGLKLNAGMLLLVDWMAPMGKRPSSIMYFLFDGGTIDDTTGLSLDEEEIEAAAFFTLVECQAALPAHIARRAPAAVAARDARRTVYLPASDAPAIL